VDNGPLDIPACAVKTFSLQMSSPKLSLLAMTAPEPRGSSRQ
jgi:hypothetical protein